MMISQHEVEWQVCKDIKIISLSFFINSRIFHEKPNQNWVDLVFYTQKSELYIKYQAIGTTRRVCQQKIKRSV